MLVIGRQYTTTEWRKVITTLYIHKHVCVYISIYTCTHTHIYIFSSG